MHLNSLTIRRFRSCDAVTITFRSDLTVLVGENNGGKSNVIDAIRLLTLPLNGRRDRYPEDEDLRQSASPATFELFGEYANLSDTMKGLLISAVPDPTKDSAFFGLRYELRSASAPRGRTMQWAGKFETAEPESSSTDLIRHVYLPALRDAHQALGSGSGTRVMALFRHFLPKADEGAFIDAVRRDAQRPPLLETINTEIETSLGALTGGVRPQHARLDFAEESLLDVARALRFRLADAGFALDDIRASGLGYSNLLYIATVAVELAKAREADLTLFLVEEPEAHLHPQLQMLVLEFLLEKARESQAAPPVPGQPEGRIQVIVSTHSPNLTAWVSPKHLVVLRSERTIEGDDTAGVMPSSPGPEPTRPQPAVAATPSSAPARTVSAGIPAPTVPVRRVKTVAIPIAHLAIDDKTLEKISRYLDVTRSAMLFGSRALLVEGIAESLLLPVFARCLLFAADRDSLLRFKGAVLVAIDGVDFLPYVEVLLRPYKEARVADRVVVVTDADPSVEGNRKGDLEAFATGVGARHCLDVFTNTHTLEHELLLAGNEAVVKAAFLSLHRRSGDDWTKLIEGVAPEDRPNAFLRLLDTKKTRKGDLAQAIAERVEAGDPFQVPGYLRSAIERIAAP